MQTPIRTTTRFLRLAPSRELATLCTRHCITCEALPIINKGDIIIAISQSGETADTLVAIEKAKEQGAIIFGVVNVVGSSIARISDGGAYTHAGPEIGVASTKAFTSQLSVLTLMALNLAIEKGTIPHSYVNQ